MCMHERPLSLFWIKIRMGLSPSPPLSLTLSRANATVKIARPYELLCTLLSWVKQIKDIVTSA